MNFLNLKTINGHVFLVSDLSSDFFKQNASVEFSTLKDLNLVNEYITKRAIQTKSNQL